MFNNFIGLMFVSWMFIYLTRVLIGGFIGLFYKQFDDGGEIKIRFK